MTPAGETTYLHLVSSSSEIEYVADVFESIALPTGCIQHFRYRVEHLTDELRSLLGPPGAQLSPRLEGIPVVVSYLYQVKTSDDAWKRIALYPVRHAVLEDAFKTGDEPTDVAHFHFALGSRISDPATWEEIRAASGLTAGTVEVPGKWYASLQNVAFAGIPIDEDPESAFRAIAESILPEHLTTTDSEGAEKRLSPIYIFIEPFRKKQEGDHATVAPSRHELSAMTFHMLEEGVLYLFDVAFHVPRQYRGLRGTIELVVADKVLFSVAGRNPVLVDSRYDRETWLVVPSLVDEDTWTSLTVEILSTEDGSSDTLSVPVSLHLPVKIVRRTRRRIVVAAFSVIAVILLSLGASFIGLGLGAEPAATWLVPVGVSFLLLGLLLRGGLELAPRRLRPGV